MNSFLMNDDFYDAACKFEQAYQLLAYIQKAETNFKWFRPQGEITETYNLIKALFEYGEEPAPLGMVISAYKGVLEANTTLDLLIHNRESDQYIDCSNGEQAALQNALYGVSDLFSEVVSRMEAALGVTEAQAA
ncbi:hypothetical protein GMES_0204 [Paraglaciecola mesophila KMM 241]|uniref:Uncharacterized protein n=1 Tax=Paraglaciecola mesophila KMM 241 TaxID=1128912 RepID=K6XPE5_9ALTE|nr:hypothetical protein [Paraglaciecola mesophila]GAC22514.1 hypothetical protein GMES_0204 [Paraglaciecola mesophila KMM 241]